TASHYSAHCEKLVLASTPPPALRLRRRHQVYLRAPWVFGPLFLMETPFRVHRELRAAMADPRARRRFSWNAVRTGFGAPVSLRRMAARARIATTDSVTADCARITIPTLIVTGEPHLDRVVQVESWAGYEGLIPQARRVTLRDTGPLGPMTRPGEFAAIVRAFVQGVRHAAAGDRRTGV